jgi:hypothetical protein
MKKLVALLLALVMVLGCTAALAEIHGMGSVTKIAAPKNAADGNDGSQQINTTFCAVALDADNKIVAVSFDVAQNTVKWNEKSEGTTPETDNPPTKLEKKEAYGMKATSAGKGSITVNAAAGGEWYEQAAFLESYCIGKTLDEVISGIAMGEDNYPTGADVVVGITIHVNELIEALGIAIMNAK